MKNGQTEQNQGFRLDSVCPKAFKGTFVRSMKHKNYQK